MVVFYTNARFLEQNDGAVSDSGKLVLGGQGVIAAVGLQTEASLVLALTRYDLVAEAEVRGIDEDLVEYVVLELRSPQREVGDRCFLEEGLCLAGDVPRVAGEWFLRVGLYYVADEAGSRDLAEWIDEPCFEVGNE